METIFLIVPLAIIRYINMISNSYINETMELFIVDKNEIGYNNQPDRPRNCMERI